MEENCACAHTHKQTHTPSYSSSILPHPILPNHRALDFSIWDLRIYLDYITINKSLSVDFFLFFLKGQNSSAATRGGASKTGAHLEWEAVSLTPKEPFSKPGWTSETPTAAWESSVGGEVLATLGPPAASSCHDILSLTLKAPVEEAVLLCVAVKDVASMPLSAEAPWR